MNDLLIGGNPASDDNFWGTKEEAVMAFCQQLEAALQGGRGKYLLVRHAPELKKVGNFQGCTRWCMRARFVLVDAPAEDPSLNETPRVSGFPS